MKRTNRCPRCGSREVGHLESLDEITAEDDTSYVAVGVMRYKPEYIPPPVLRPKDSRSEVRKDRRMPWAAETTTKAGTMEVYLCARCGYLERHVQDPAWLPFERLQGFTWVNGADGDEAGP